MEGSDLCQIQITGPLSHLHRTRSHARCQGRAPRGASPSLAPQSLARFHCTRAMACQQHPRQIAYTLCAAQQAIATQAFGHESYLHSLQPLGAPLASLDAIAPEAAARTLATLPCAAQPKALSNLTCNGLLRLACHWCFWLRVNRALPSPCQAFRADGLACRLWQQALQRGGQLVPPLPHDLLEEARPNCAQLPQPLSVNLLSTTPTQLPPASCKHPRGSVNPIITAITMT